MTQRPREAVELRHHNDIQLAGVDRLQEPTQRRPRVQRTRHSLVNELPDQLPALRLDEAPTLAGLTLKRRPLASLLDRRNPSVCRGPHSTSSWSRPTVASR